MCFINGGGKHNDSLDNSLIFDKQCVQDALQLQIVKLLALVITVLWSFIDTLD